MAAEKKGMLSSAIKCSICGARVGSAEAASSPWRSSGARPLPAAYLNERRSARAKACRAANSRA